MPIGVLQYKFSCTAVQFLTFFSLANLHFKEGWKCDDAYCFIVYLP